MVMLAVSLDGFTRTASGWSLRLSVRVKVMSAPSEAVMPTAPEAVGSLSMPRNMATMARMPVCAGIVSRTSTEAEEKGLTRTVFCEKTAVAAMLLGVSPAGTKTRLPALTMTSSATISKAKSRAVWLVRVSVCVSPCPKDPLAMMTAGLREMEGFSGGWSGVGGVAGLCCAKTVRLKQSRSMALRPFIAGEGAPRVEKRLCTGRSACATKAFSVFIAGEGVWAQGVWRFSVRDDLKEDSTVLLCVFLCH